MKIFITIPWFLPAFKAGGPIRSLANLVDIYHDSEKFIFTGNREIDGVLLKGIESNQWIKYNNTTQVWYASKENIRQQITEQTNKIKPDIIYMIGLYSWDYTIVPLIYCKAPKKIISVRGMLHPGALRQKAFKKKLFIRLFKFLGFHKRIVFHATDEEERKFIQDVFGSGVTIEIAGNIPALFEMQPLPIKRKGALRLVTIALISPMKNILAVLRALQQVKGEIHYQIFGAVKDATYWEKCKKEIRSLPPNVTVEYNGEASFDEVGEILKGCHVFILPSESENFGHAIYEALSAGRPVITSMHTPWKELDKYRAGMNVNPENIHDLTNAIDFFSGMEISTLEEWSVSAHQYAVDKLDRMKILKQYEVMFSFGDKATKTRKG